MHTRASLHRKGSNPLASILTVLWVALLHPSQRKSLLCPLHVWKKKDTYARNTHTHESKKRETMVWGFECMNQQMQRVEGMEVWRGKEISWMKRKNGNVSQNTMATDTGPVQQKQMSNKHSKPLSFTSTSIWPWKTNWREVQKGKKKRKGGNKNDKIANAKHTKKGWAVCADSLHEWKWWHVGMHKEKMHPSERWTQRKGAYTVTHFHGFATIVTSKRNWDFQQRKPSRCPRIPPLCNEHRRGALEELSDALT